MTGGGAILFATSLIQQKANELMKLVITYVN